MNSPLEESRAPAPERTSLSRYQWKLLFFLSVATFFEGWDFLALAQLLPTLRAEMHLTERAAGTLFSVINIGPILAYLVVRKADRWGRRPVLNITILGYTCCSLVTGLAPNVWAFGAAQLLARIFLLGEWAVATVIAAEEYPADRRGFVIGTIQAISSFGSIACAGLVPYVLRLPFGWRGVFFVGAVPLLLIAFLRRGLRETRRFRERAAAAPAEAPSLLRIWHTPWRGRVVLLAVIWGATYACTTQAVLFWKDFALNERHFTEAQAGFSMAIAAIATLPLVLLVGKLLDVIGRRAGAVIIFVTAALGVAGSYTLSGRVSLTVALLLGTFGASAVLPVLNAYTAELFPTELRSDAFAWANNLLGRITPVVAPLVIGWAAVRTGWGPAMAATTVGPIIALILILWRLPETRGRELEETSAVPGKQ